MSVTAKRRSFCFYLIKYTEAQKISKINFLRKKKRNIVFMKVRKLLICETPTRR